MHASTPERAARVAAVPDPDAVGGPRVAPDGRSLRAAVTVEQCWHAVPGGIALATVELLRALRAVPDLRLVGVSAWHRRPPRSDLVPPVATRRMPMPRRVLYESWQRLRAPRVESITGRVDVVHDLGYVTPPSRAPLIATVHDVFFLRYPAHYTKHSLAVLRRGFELARRDATLVICPSRATMSDCVDAGIDADRLRLVPWGCRAVDGAASDPAAGRYGLERPYVLFAGTVEPRKNLRRVIDAFRSLDRGDVELVLVGPDGWHEDVDDALATVRGRTRRLGVLPRHDLERLYREASVVVYPSLGEGFGLPVLEAMAQGAPVVTSAGTATEEVAGDAAILVDPLDVEAIAAGIERVLDDRALASRLGSAARERAATFTWERSASLVASVYAEAAGTTPA